ncbi:uncharacterized protein CLUP02_03160 [Colletotrichum lupini]|uniref:Uncharacterized protein n=1 Tax=Colletotrichum lupini TaxID=145971 RepID=A0A9Q8SHX0_9PEZI|nr:uncharacterized protein CLUP02_03160 [Colletotrichum lupini]UQC77689.1 hypothetical protein CLUP02_03160 [Colletotrichum lupini]
MLTCSLRLTGRSAYENSQLTNFDRRNHPCLDFRSIRQIDIRFLRKGNLLKVSLDYKQSVEVDYEYEDDDLRIAEFLHNKRTNEKVDESSTLASEKRDCDAFEIPTGRVMSVKSEAWVRLPKQY